MAGAGYLNPTLLLPDPKTGRRGESNITKSGAQAWIDWNTKWYVPAADIHPHSRMSGLWPLALFITNAAHLRSIMDAERQNWACWELRYRQFDLSFTGFLINGDQGPLTNASLKMYDSFSPDGVVVTTAHDPLGA